MSTTAATEIHPGSLITGDGQVQFAGLLFGPGTPFRIASEGLGGWEELPAIDTGDAARPAGHGSWPGALWAGPRTITAQVWVMPDPGAGADEIREHVRALRRATAVDHREQWLAVRLHGETLACKARVLQRVVPTDQRFVGQGVAKATVQWQATDPRRYEPEEQLLGTELPSRENGLTWPLVWPLAWGRAGSTGDLTVTHHGSAPIAPLITFRGPCDRPSLRLPATGVALSYDIELAQGDELTVDTSDGSVLLNGTASRKETAESGSAPEELFTFDPGDTLLSFRAASGGPGARAEVRWRTAHW
ncbi:phage tail family protein [Embleya sp. NBC_00888]|uniref:phage distal tail protein n=1 Tax=Embleya sp. NBC_00888 TaxID=2975960 RepID=UPI003866C20C|nr:phage tail family protein [Embleya sp. NBC_00888]